jgi:hypothetical protein
VQAQIIDSIMSDCGVEDMLESIFGGSVCRTDVEACKLPCEAAEQACCSDLIHRIGMCGKCVQNHCPLAAASDGDSCGVSSCSSFQQKCSTDLEGLPIGVQRKSVLCGNQGDQACGDMYSCMREVFTKSECQGGGNSGPFRWRLESHLDAVDQMCSGSGLSGSSLACRNENSDGSCEITHLPKL